MPFKKFSKAQRSKFINAPYGKKLPGGLTMNPTPFDVPGAGRGTRAPGALAPSGPSGSYPPLAFGFEMPNKEIGHGYIGPTTMP